MEHILKYVRVKRYETERKSRKYALDAVTTRDIAEKHRLEVELSYLMGKNSAYSEIESLVNKDSMIKIELKKALNMIAEDVVAEWRLHRLKQCPENAAQYSEFEMGVEAMKKKLIDILLPGDIDVTVLEVQKRKRD